MKCCRKCGSELPLTEFYHRMDHGKLRPQSWCKDCFNNSNKAKRAELAARIPPGVSWLMPATNSILGQVYRMPRGHPMRERFYRNRAQWFATSVALENWYRDDCQSGQEILA